MDRVLVASVRIDTDNGTKFKEYGIYDMIICQTVCLSDCSAVELFICQTVQLSSCSSVKSKCYSVKLIRAVQLSSCLSF